MSVISARPSGSLRHARVTSLIHPLAGGGYSGCQAPSLPPNGTINEPPVSSSTRAPLKIAACRGLQGRRAAGPGLVATGGDLSVTGAGRENARRPRQSDDDGSRPPTDTDRGRGPTTVRHPPVLPTVRLSDRSRLTDRPTVRPNDRPAAGSGAGSQCQCEVRSSKATVVDW